MRVSQKYISIWTVLGIAMVCNFLFIQCHSKNLYPKETSSLDSLKIVLQVKKQELNKSTIHMSQYGFDKYEPYKKFLLEHIKDTILRVEATALQLYIKSGNLLTNYNMNMPKQNGEVELTISQLQLLSEDLKSNNIPANKVQDYYENEIAHATMLIARMEKDLLLVNSALNGLNTSRSKVEDFLRKNNLGELPKLVNDSVH
jgi:hypothetical protein